MCLKIKTGYMQSEVGQVVLPAYEGIHSEYEISPGKAALLQKITMDYPKLSYDSLARITMNQLPLYLEKQGVDIRDYTYYTGTEFPEKEEDGGSSGGNIKPETGETVGGQDKQEQDETSENIEDTSEQQEDFAESTIHSV